MQKQSIKNTLILLGIVLATSFIQVSEVRAQACEAVKLDIIFAVDTSGSMNEERETLDAAIGSTVTALNQQELFDVAYRKRDIANILLDENLNDFMYDRATMNSLIPPTAREDGNRVRRDFDIHFFQYAPYHEKTQAWALAVWAVGRNGDQAGLWRDGASKVIMPISDDITFVSHGTVRAAAAASTANDVMVFPFSTKDKDKDDNNKLKFRTIVADFDTPPSDDSGDGRKIATKAEVDAIPNNAQRWLAEQTGGVESFYDMPDQRDSGDYDRDRNVNETIMSAVIQKELTTVLESQFDADGDGHRTVRCADGDDWYDNPDLDAPGATLKQLSYTLNDLDLDGYAREDAVNCSVARCEPVDHDSNGCINPGAYEGACPTDNCVVAAKDAATGRVPHNLENPGASPVLPHPWDVCSIEATYGCALSSDPADGPLITAKYQCDDGVDNDLDNVLEGTNEENEPGCWDDDIDGDGLVSATHFSCIPETTCDYYDDPRSFGADTCEEVLDPNGAAKTWLEIFKNTSDNDLDKDEERVAIGRLIGNRADELRFLKDPSSEWKDWYDNPFTADLSNLSVKPTLPQLRDTINDLDLDTFAAQSWAGFFNEDAPSEPDEADVTVVLGNNRAGCTFPGALEETCSDCTAYVPDSGTGRIPDYKIDASFSPKNVCQIEAYYEDIGMKKVFPGATAGINADIAPNPYNGKNLLSVTAQCQDSVDNDLDDIMDEAELECPKKGGIVPCGRYSDNPLTAVDESQPCGFCHFFYLFDNVVNKFIWQIVPGIAILLLIIGGLAVAISRGNASQLTRGRDIIIWTFIGYAIILVGWTVLNSFFGGIGVKKWTGMAGEGGGFESINAQRVEMQDTDAEWAQGELAGFSITINHPDWENAEVRRIASNTDQHITVNTALPAGTVAEMTYKIGGWWQFSCR